MWWYYLPSPCYLVVPGASLVHRSPPTIEELLWTIRDAWPPPRSLSLDSEKRERTRQPLEAMGTGSKGKSGPRMGLPLRRYSVPEIVMRKYSLSRAQTSASEIGTVPTPSVPSISTSQESKTTKRMSHKACQTSPPNNTDDTQSSTYATGSLSFESEPPLIPTVTIIEETTDSNDNAEQQQKHSSSSNEYSQSEDIKCYSARDRRVYKSDSSLPGAVAQSTMFLTVPEVFLDPHDSPQEGGEEEVFGSDIIKCIVQSPSVLSSDKMVDTGDFSQETNLRELTPTQQRQHILRSRSNSIPKSQGPSVKMTLRTGSADGKNHNGHATDDEMNIDLGESISPEGTETPAHTCHTFDSQGNMSECYITDCDMCTAEGRKCCSLSDSGSQSCSFTSPEMLTTNELKTSSDYTTSSMTLDQSVSDRTTSTQDSTVSLTSTSPESEDAKTKHSGIHISPILVIDSEAMLTNLVDTKTKERELPHLSETSSRSKYNLADPIILSDTFPAVISSETALVPEGETKINKNASKDKNTDNIDSMRGNMTLSANLHNQTYSELNNNKLFDSVENDSRKQTITDESGNKETNEVSQYKDANYSSNYLYLTESDSGSCQVQNGDKPISVQNYATNYLYLTDSESSPSNVQSIMKPNTGNYSTNYLYLTESDSGSSQVQNDEVQPKGETYSTNYLYLTESSESHSSKINSENVGTDYENKPIQGNNAINYMYLTEESSSSQVLDGSAGSEIEKRKGDGYTTNFLHLTEESNSSKPKNDSTNSRSDVKPPNGTNSKHFLYFSESESKSSNSKNRTLTSEVQPTEKNHPPTGDYTTNALYLTESESGSSENKINTEQPKSGNYSKNCLYLTGSESGSSQTNNNGEQPKSGNYSTNCLYLTESESGSSQAKNNDEQPKSGNYSTNFLCLTESESSQTKNNSGQPKSGNYSKNCLYLTESESGSSQTKNNGEQPKSGNYSTNCLYLTESESGTSENKSNTNQPKSGNYKTNCLYLTESESGSSQTNNNSEQPKSGNYSTNCLYLTESESGSSQTKNNGKQPKSGNYSTNCLYLTESESSQTKNNSGQPKSGTYSKNCLYLTESESGSSQTKNNGEQPKSGNYSTNCLYLTESESGTSENKSNTNQPKSGNYKTNCLYLTESESGSSQTKNNGKQPKSENYSTNCLYLTESESGSSQTKNDCGEPNSDNYLTNYLYLTESDTVSIQGKNVVSQDTHKNSGGKATNLFYMSEENSVNNHIKNGNTERCTKQPNGGKYTLNYLYLTEDESGINPDSLELERTSPKESEFVMDSLATNESTEKESNLLENLGFCENQLKVQNQPCARGASERIRVESQQNFYGNEKYELLLKDSAHNKDNFLGNVMSVPDENNIPSIIVPKRKPSPSPRADISGVSPLTLDDREWDNLGNNECDIDISQISSERETSMGSVAGGTYWELPGKELVIPRFSAMPRTLSMIVNTSSVDCSSDSDLSLADSLEDSRSDDKSKGMKLYNKYDNRLARGDVIALLPEESSAPKKTTNTAHAYFLSLTGEEGEIKMKHIPDELKQKLLKRYNEVKKHSDHSPKTKSKSSSKKGKKHHHHPCSSSKTAISPKSSDRISKSSECQSNCDKKGQISTFTQWEDLGSSKESSDTLVPSDFSNKDKDKVFEGDYKAKNVSNSPYHFEKLQEGNQSNLHSWLEKLPKGNIDLNNVADKTPRFKDFGTSTSEKDSCSDGKTNTNRFVNSWVQCENMPHVDTILDEEISKLLIKNLKNDESTQERGKFKCSEHKVPWFKDIDIQVSENDLIENKIAEHAQRIIQIQSHETDSNSIVTSSSSVQTVEGDLKQNNLQEINNKQITTKSNQQDESNKIKLKLNVSQTNNNYDENDAENKYCEDGDGKEKSDTSPGEKVTFATNKPTNHQEKVIFSKHSTKFNMKTIPSRRPGNLSTRFKQKFEVIPEEKSGSMESSNDERKSPKPVRGRRASMPSDTILTDIGHITHKSSGSSSSSNEKNDTEDCDHIRNIHTSPLEGSDYHRRHTIHGNLSSRNNKADMVNNSSFEKNEQSRRHTIHGSLALNSKNEAMLKQLNLLGGTLLKGRVFGKQSGVMIGRFRPVNEETQVQKDERSLVEEHLERLTMDTTKGREALAVAKAEEQEDLMTLSKGWINFYLLRDSQDLNSEGSNGEEGSHEQGSEDRSRRAPPAMKTVTVVGKPEEEVRHQYTVHINASPEIERLPDLGPSHKSKTPSLSLSPDLTLPDITPSSSSPTTSPPLDLPHIHPRPPSRTKRNINDKNKHNSKRPPDVGDKKEKVHSIDNEHNLRYLKLSSVKQELQTEKTYFARSGEVACSELSPSSQSSSSVMVDSPTLPSIKWPSRQLQRRAPRHTRHPHHPANPQACWTVTLAGSSGNPTQPPPDVEMRLSFSNASRGPPTSQSDSGLGEDGPCERKTKQQALPPALPQNNQWKVMLKTQQENDRSTDQTRADKRQSLPDFNFTPSAARTKKNSKRRGQEDEDRPASVKVQEILEHNISLHKSSLTEEWMEGLSVTGLAITPERKPRVPTMSERDLTRQWLHRTRLSQ